MSGITLKFNEGLTEKEPKQNSVLIISPHHYVQKLSYSVLKCKFGTLINEETFQLALKNFALNTTDSTSMYFNHINITSLPKSYSRHNTPSQSHSITKIVKKFSTGVDESIVIICEKRDVFASACAVARAYPLYCRKSKVQKPITKNIEFLLMSNSGDVKPGLTADEVSCLSTAAEAIREASRIVDMPCGEMNTDAFLQEINKVGESLGITAKVVSGEELLKEGLGGIYNVGKAADHPPALAVLSYKAPKGQQNIAICGKGITFDTGGLSIKSKSAMCGMKRDCGGAAAVLEAFFVAVKMGFTENLHAVLCLAENAVGPKALRPDDIITMYSGKTVEINNTDAEGRLVLGDGVAYAAKDLKADVVIDMATLTGAQGIATGKYHGAVVTNDEEWEQATVRAGRVSGDLIHPLPFSPELHFPEFNSTLADMKNSVADRSNAQSSCAALFIFAHLGFTFPGIWVHIDMASPSHSGDRATGYGVALLTALLGHASSNPLLQSIAPFGHVNGPDTGKAKKIRLL